MTSTKSKVVVFTFSLIFLITESCQWKELLPNPAINCSRLYVHNELFVNEPALFIISLPSREKCESTVQNCPEVEVPFPYTFSLGSREGVKSPPKFVKISLSSKTSFSQSVEMAYLGNDFYGFTLIPIEEGVHDVITSLDFDGCSEKDMYGLNCLDLILANEENAGSSKKITLNHHYDFRGCHQMVFKNISTHQLRIASERSTKPRITEEKERSCDWSYLIGAWKLNPTTKLPNQFIPENKHCKIPITSSLAKYWKTFEPKSSSSLTSSTSSNVCIIGDSNVRNPWNLYEKLIPPMLNITSIYYEGGGLDMDLIDQKRFTSQTYNEGMKLSNESMFLINDHIKNLRIARVYQWDDAYQTQNTKEYVKGILDFDRNPFDACLFKHPETNLIIFYIGSHNFGLSYIEAKHAVKHIIEKMVKWQSSLLTSSLSKRKAPKLLFVSIPDARHEMIDKVNDGKFGAQALFRNSFRTNNFNKAFREALIEEELNHYQRIDHDDDQTSLHSKQQIDQIDKQKEIEKKSLIRKLKTIHGKKSLFLPHQNRINNHHQQSQLGSSEFNIHFLDLFHMTLGLHWNGHEGTLKNRPLIDPVHFHPAGIYDHFISALWHAVWDLFD